MRFTHAWEGADLDRENVCGIQMNRPGDPALPVHLYEAVFGPKRDCVRLFLTAG